MSVQKRVAGHACQVCANKVLDPKKSLAKLHPDLAKEYSKTNLKKASEMFPKSNQEVWWDCKQCGNQYQMSVTMRVRGGGCKKCRSLAILYPEIAKEYSDNNLLPADEISAKSNYKVKWNCPDCKKPFWQIVANRTRRGSGCQKCAKKKTRGWRKRLQAK